MESTVQQKSHLESESLGKNNSTLPLISGAALEWLQVSTKGRDLVDLFTFNEDNFALKSIRILLDQRPLEIEYPANYPANVHLNHFYFESRNREKVFGSSNVGIGYPMLLTQIEQFAIHAPLFFWRLRIDSHPQHIDSWNLSRPVDGPLAIPNYPLFDLIDAVHGTEFSHRATRMVEENELNTATLKELSDGLSLILNLKEGSYALGVTGAPTALEVAELQIQGTLHWSAVAGLMPTIPKRIEIQEPIVQPDLASGMEWEHNFAHLPLDATQREALMAAQKNALTVVEGASGTGKTYTAANIVVNALSNGYKVMVVSKSLNALKSCQNYLLQAGIGDLSFLIRDINADKLMLLDMLRAAAVSKANYAYDKDVYRTVLTKTYREQQKLDKSWAALHHPIFGDWDFTEVAGQFLRSNRAIGKEIVASQLDPKQFEFTKEEYDEIRNDIKSSEPLFKKFPNLNHPLTHLEGGLFKNRAQLEAGENVQDLVRSTSDQASALHHRFISSTNEYAEMLTDNYEQVFENLYLNVKQIRNKIEDGTNNFGPDFDKSSGVLDGLYGVISDRGKEISTLKSSILKQAKELQTQYSLSKHFVFDFPPDLDGKTMRNLEKVLNNFEDALVAWRNRTPAVVREDVRRMNGKNANLIVDYKTPTLDLEDIFSKFIQQLNQSGLYSVPFEGDWMTVPQKQLFLEDILAKLENTRFYMRDFGDFFGWQSHWLALNKPSRLVIEALGKMKPRNWMAAFESWYLHSILQKHFSADMVWEKDTIEMWLRGTNKLKASLPNQIGSLWAERKKNALKELKAVNPSTYNLWFGKKNRDLGKDVSAEILVKEYILPLTETLPVLFVTPQVAADVMRLSNMLFDLVIVDEAHNIPKQDCYTLFDQAKNMVVFGDEKQDMTPFEEDDFLEYAKNIGIKKIELAYQHQPVPEEWIRFNQTAFNTPFQRIPSRFSAKDVTTITPVGGRYEEETRINEAEARQIIEWLSQIEPNIDKMYPSIGIACATVEQRDYIAGQLLKIMQRKSAGFEKLLLLQHNGLGVHQFGEMQGHHVDILMVSLTIGSTDSKNTVSKQMGFWDTTMGLNQLHVALTRSSSRIFIAHSIPQQYLLQAKASGQQGTTILAHLVEFGEAIKNDKNENISTIIEEMRQNLGHHNISFPSKVFMEEVEIALQPYFEPGQIKRDTSIAGVTVPMLIRSTRNDTTQDYVLLFDGVLAESDYPSYEWEQKLKEYLNQNDIIEIPTLSLKWWKSPKQEARKLAGRILGVN